ncbi:MAG TPA: helix-turn-helix transcriptional regulator [Tepidisphaeraceae bacterium]|nr:helix-turn-helix transcriptional regulator [Tepidisphaeraceae bacterium]
MAILHRLIIGNDPAKQAMLEEERANMDIAQKIYDLREQAGLTQRQLAALIGTTASVICRLEAADYQGHSLAMLNRIAAALGKRVRIDFVPLRQKRSA